MSQYRYNEVFNVLHSTALLLLLLLLFIIIIMTSRQVLAVIIKAINIAEVRKSQCD